MIYLDNAATSFPKPECVYRDMERCLREYCANPGRGGHALSIRAGMAVNEARDILSGFFNIDDPLRLAFAKNATEALNTGIKGIMEAGSHVVATAMEHNSVMRPLRALEKEAGIEVTLAQCNALGETEPDAIRKAIKKNTSLIVCTLSSNVNGIIMPVRDIGKVAAETGIPYMVDASQGAGSLKLDVKEQNIGMLAFPGHKGLMGPQGTGGLFVKEGIRLKPLMQGGTGSNSEYEYQPEIMPDLLESGTLNTPAIVGLCSGVKCIIRNGQEKLHRYKFSLVKRLTAGLKEIRGVSLYSVPDINRNSGIVAMNLEGLDSTELSYILDKKYGIATRAGLHCAPSAHRVLGTINKGVVRFSVGAFNTADEMDYTISAIIKISETCRGK